MKPADGSAEVAQCIFDAYRTFDFSKSRSYEVTLEYGRPADAGTATSPLDSVRAEMLALQMRKWAAAHADGGSRDGGRTFEEPPPGFPAALVDSSDRVRGCWEEALQRKRLRDVQLSMRIVVSSDGKITTADVTDGTYREAQLEGCLSRVVKSLELPAVPGGGSADFTQRFTFSAGGGH